MWNNGAMFHPLSHIDALEFLWRKNFKHCSELTARCFWSIMSSRSAYFEQSFHIAKHSCTIGQTLSFYICGASTISINFTLRLPEIIFVLLLATSSERLIFQVQSPSNVHHAKKQCYINIWNSFLSIFFKLTKVASVKMLSYKLIFRLLSSLYTCISVELSRNLMNLILVASPVF